MKETFNKYSWLIIILLILLLGWAYCSKPKIVYKEPSKVYQTLDTLKKKETIFRDIVKYRDTIIFKDRIKWRNLKATYDTTISHEIISVCDTIIFHDSLAISARDKVIKNDSNIKVVLFKIMEQKNDTIKLLNKEIKRQKWQKRGILALWVVREGLGVATKLK